MTRKYGVPRGFEKVVNILTPLGAKGRPYDVVFELHEGLWLRAELNSHLDRRLYWHGHYNKHVERLLKENVREGSVAIDCGANIGMYSLVMAHLAGSTGRVIAIEPHDQARKKLEANILQNGFQDRVTVLPCALSENRGKTILHYPPPDHANQGNASLYRKADGWLKKEVDVRTIDDIADELNLSSLDIIRCDVQGGELNVLRGGEKTIHSHRPLISIRYNRELASSAGVKIGALTGYLHGLGYSTFLNLRGKFVRWEENISVDDAEFLFMHGVDKTRDTEKK